MSAQHWSLLLQTVVHISAQRPSPEYLQQKYPLLLHSLLFLFSYLKDRHPVNRHKQATLQKKIQPTKQKRDETTEVLNTEGENCSEYLASGQR